jgi:hypothetical protein
LSIEETCSRKQKSTDLYNPPSGKKISAIEQCDHNGSAPEGCIGNIFYSENNSSKLCAEGAIQNPMSILHDFKHDMDQFWIIVTSSVHLIPQALGESSVPKAVVKFGVQCDSIQKSLWILHKISSSPLQMCFELTSPKTCNK